MHPLLLGACWGACGGYHPARCLACARVCVYVGGCLLRLHGSLVSVWKERVCDQPAAQSLLIYCMSRSLFFAGVLSPGGSSSNVISTQRYFALRTITLCGVYHSSMCHPLAWNATAMHQ
jgi:hypothetical protein